MAHPTELPPALRIRLPVYGLAALLAFIGILAGSALRGLWLLDAELRPLPSDFISFWAAGSLALRGQAAQAYDWGVVNAVQLAALPTAFEGFWPFLNPPTFLMAVAPFALLPFTLAWLAFILLTATGFALALRLVVPAPLLPALLAAPASLWCAAGGQNGFLTAALMTASLALLERHPRLAGLCLGLLSYKPQFGLLIPLFLLLDRRWEAFAAATFATLAFAALSLLVLGAPAWLAFLGSVGTSGQVLRDGGSQQTPLQSLYGLVLALGGSPSVAATAQALLVAGLAAMLVHLARQPAPLACKAAVLVAASFLASPYAYAYDAVLLTGAAAFLLRDGLERGMTRAEAALILLACILAAGFPLLANTAAPLGAALLMALGLHRAQRRWRPAARPHTSKGSPT